MNHDERRRAFVSLPLAAAGAAWGKAALGQVAASAPISATAPAATLGGDDSPTRLALLVGNRAYPAPFDLPPVYKNVRDLGGALQARGFKVSSALDQNPAQMQATIQAFAKVAAASPPDSTILFYYTGHGMQIDAENLMLGSGVAPDAAVDTLVSSSLQLRRDVIDQLPRRAAGLTIAVIDACRTSLRAALKATDGFNQVEAPLGCLIVFSTGAGKPAIAPAVDTLNTFYTASLVKLLGSSDGETSFSDLFRLVKFDVQETMENYPIAAIRQFTQIPFIAENTQVRFPLALRPETQAAPPKFSAADEAAAWQSLEESIWPADVVKLADAYLKNFPASKLAGGARVALEGATEAVKALRSSAVHLYRRAFQPKISEPRWLAEWRKAARGDKDAAARIGRAYLNGSGEIAADRNRYEGWMQYAAALGNGIASYELAVYYRRQEQPTPAAQYETRARDLGYTPPPSLDNQRK